MPRRRRRRFTPEQKADAVRMARQVGNIAQVAQALDPSENSLRSWLKQADLDEGNGPEGALASEECEELAQLRRTVRILERKAAAFFAKDLDQPWS